MTCPERPISARTYKSIYSAAPDPALLTVPALSAYAIDGAGDPMGGLAAFPCLR